MYSLAHSSTDDSNVSELSALSNYSKTSFRVSVCLRRYFSDVRARAFVLVRPARRVRWLQRRLRRLFALRGAFCLRVAGHLLPRAEPLRLLRAGELVEVIPLPETRAGNQMGQVADAPIEATETQPEEKTITSTSFSADITVYNAAFSNGDDHTMETARHYQDREDSGPSAATLPPAVAARAPTDAADCGPEDTLQAAVGDVSTGGEGTLLGVKRRALALLDALDEGPPPPRRARRRVRRRARRNATPAPSPSPSAPLRSPGDSPRASPRAPVAGAAAPRDVARNEDACARKPRMVHSLDLDNI